jgi:hypothetical protein
MNPVKKLNLFGSKGTALIMLLTHREGPLCSCCYQLYCYQVFYVSVVVFSGVF